jgi:two-component system response regulator AtoC
VSARVLVVDDEPAVRFAVEEALAGGGFDVVGAGSVAEAVPLASGVAAVVTDLVMPGEDGLALAARLRELDPDLPVVLLTARGSERVAVQAMKAGVHDYLAKPYAVEELRLVVARAVETRQLRRAGAALALERLVGQSIVGESRAWRALMEQVRRAGRREVTVLVRGATGTGKELVAAALHAESPRRDRPFVRFNCAAIPAELAEAELFGHARGAFTGAATDRRGFFAQADGGTLVLDEVGELPAAVQATLLRALQSGEIQRVGARAIERVDVRVVACTNRDLRAEVAAGRFREDLFYRLAVIELEVPALRERREDLPLLVEALRRRWCARLGIEEVRFTPALVAALAARDWPGNVRELENAIARILTLGEGGELGPEALGADPAPAGAGASLRAQLDAFERQVLRRVLAECQGNRSEAARRLGITRTTLLDKLERHGLGA